MAVAALPFTGFTPEAIQFLADLAQNNDRAWFQPRKADYERLLKEPMERSCVALADRFADARHPAPGRPEALALPDLPRHPVQQGQVALQDPLGASFPWIDGGRRGGGAGRRQRRTATAATSTSSPARCTSAAGCGCPRSRASTRSDGRSSTTPDRVRAALEDRPSSPGSARRNSHEDAQASPAGLPGRSPDGRHVSAGRTSSSADACPTPRSARRTCRTARRRLRGGDAGLPVPRNAPLIGWESSSGGRTGRLGLECRDVGMARCEPWT